MASPVSDYLYERYKIGTKHVVQWLAETGGKSTTEAVVVISSKEITELASAILQAAGPNREAPKGIESTVTVLKDVIAGRSECAVWYQRTTPESSKDDAFVRCQQSHRDFIDVLRGVLSSLEGVLEVSQDRLSKTQRKKLAKMKSMPPTIDSGIATANLFDSLNLHKPPNQPHLTGAKEVVLPASTAPEAETASLSKAAKKSKKIKIPRSAAPVFELEPQEQDAEFAMWCLFKDCHQIRLHIRGIWKEYVNRLISLHIAAKTTELAFLSVENIVRKFINDYPFLTTMQQVADHLQFVASIKANHIAAFEYNGQTKPVPDAAELLCIPAFVQLEIYRRIAIKDGSKELGSYQTHSHPMMAIMYGFLLETTLQNAEYDEFVQLTGRDSFMDSLRKPSETASLLTVIIFQTYMDIIGIVHKIRVPRFNALLQMKQITQDRIEAFELHLQKDSSGHVLASSITKHRESCRKLVEDGLEGYANIRLDLKAKVGELGQYRVDGFSWVVDFPVFGGALLSRIMTHMYLDGVNACDERSVVLSMAHLYRACRSSGTLRVPWKDMDFVIDHFTAHGLKLPPIGYSFDSFDESYRQYRMALGVEDGQHQQENPVNHADSVKVPLPSTKQIEKQRIHLQPTSIFSHDGREATILDQSLSAEAAAQKFSSRLSTTTSKHPDMNADEVTLSQWVSNGSLTPLDRLKLFRNQADKEEISQLFDFHHFSTVCTNAFELISSNPLLPIRTELGSYCTIAQLTDEILWEAKELGVLAVRHKAPATLVMVGTVLGDYIERLGTGLFCKRARETRDLTLRCNSDGDRVGKAKMSKEDIAGILAATNLQLSGGELKVSAGRKRSEGGAKKAGK